MAKKKKKTPERTKNIVTSLSIKIQLESYGGPKFSSVDFFESESEEVPISLDEQEVQEVWVVLRGRVEARIAERKKALIETLQSGNSPY